MVHETYRSLKEQDMAKKVIITCAITGSAHTPTMSPALPITPEEIAEQSIAAAEAGPSIIHLHARVPETGEHTGDPAIYARAIQRIRGASEAVINLTNGGNTTKTVADRPKPALAFNAENCSIQLERKSLATIN